MTIHPVLEPAAQAFVEATSTPPFLYELPPAQGRATVDAVQSPEIEVPGTSVETVQVDDQLAVDVFRPVDAQGPLPVVLYTHGAGWVFGNAHTHGRLARELALGAQAAVVFVNYSRSPEARYPVALEEVHTAASWVMAKGDQHGLDGSRLAVAGDSVGGNMTAALTLLAKERGGPALTAQVLFYPVTDAAFDTASYEQFREGWFLSREGMQWFWDQYTTDEQERAQITASPLRATTEQLTGLPPALVITAEADVLRDEGEAYAAALRAAGVPVVAVRYQGIVHDFVMLNALRSTHAAEAAIAQAGAYLRAALHPADAHHRLSRD
ncbi:MULTISPECIES: alpha/beta hydrolase [unclassified Modestobacter]|uniref:alpha/beta hydrolase n=1 Tax=unclassified Modestobacter TaxID=2643866 RepID=UPI0022AA9037|nr:MULTISPECIES: alpha/beta hydrolase [unclassified Modestobacter]MCZ2826915.1 alpha/beta hydrolase [Modestobacter sp. VKM Ac-2981]MCZ2855389.1 alpha/beta hydrolase [Modestobacter sp. VKM Ac-2982]